MLVTLLILNLVSQSRKKPYKFYHFGSNNSLQNISEIENIAISVTPSSRDEMINSLREKTIDVALILSPWPETFSYTTHEAFAAGAAVMTLIDSGNVAAKVKETGQGIVVDGEEGLISLFQSDKLIKYVQDRYKKGIKVGKLVHTGTTASLALSVNSTTEAL
jgi:hypothetical protein